MAVGSSLRESRPSARHRRAWHGAPCARPASAALQCGRLRLRIGRPQIERSQKAGRLAARKRDLGQRRGARLKRGEHGLDGAPACRARLCEGLRAVTDRETERRGEEGYRLVRCDQKRTVKLMQVRVIDTEICLLYTSDAADDL